MAIQTIHADEAADEQIYPDLPCFVSNDAEFRAAVRAGIAEIRAGQTIPLEQVEAELREIIHGHG
jgi:predicted transcriptional regulator